MAASFKNSSLKDQLRDAIKQMPADCSADDIHYQVYLIDKIRRGEASLRSGRIAHADVRKRATAWRRK